MKKVILIALGAGLLILAVVIASQMHRSAAPGKTASQDAGLLQSAEGPVQTQTAPAVVRARAKTVASTTKENNPEPVSPAAASSAGVPPPETGPSSSALFSQAVETVISPRASFDSKQIAWKQLRDSGKLDPAIKELEQRMAAEPNSPDIPAALGQAYLQKCGTIQDVREQGILGMKADQVFEAALNVDPSNWEARFTKAMAMSYWPTQMNKGNEVMEQFATLVTQQEAQAPQPHFAQTYIWLGKEYAKYGRTDFAKDIWQRGAALYPENRELRTKLEGN